MEGFRTSLPAGRQAGMTPIRVRGASFIKTFSVTRSAECDNIMPIMEINASVA
jgi:hypothetical protein